MGRSRGGGQLLHQGELVPIVPSLDDFAFGDAHDGDACDPNGTVGGRDAEMVAGVSRHGGPADHDFVVRAESVLEGELDIRKRAAKAIVELQEIGGAADFDAGRVLSNSDDIFVHQIVNRLNASFVPNFLEPAPHQNNVFFYGHAAPPCENGDSYTSVMTRRG